MYFVRKVFCFFIFFLVCTTTITHAKRTRKSRMIGGELAKPHEIKYVVSIHMNEYPGCAGAIINEKHILSAAHCVLNRTTNTFKKGLFKIVAGTNDLRNLNEAVQINVKKIYIPLVDNGSHWNPEHGIGDIALLELAKSLNFNENLKALTLPQAESEPNSKSYEGTIAKVAGYGWNEITVSYEDGTRHRNGTKDGKLQKAKALVIPNSECLYSFPPRKNDFLCAKMINYNDGTHQGTCNGDSGAPLVVNGNVVIGVLSATWSTCNENEKPASYTKVSTYLNFIRNVLSGQTKDMLVNNLA